MKDKLTTCYCEKKSNALYEQNVSGIKACSCMTCGFQTTDLMKEGERFYNEQIATLPELYKELMWKDVQGRSWFPGVLNMPDHGMVFVNGKSTDEWKWSAALSIDVKEEEKTKFPIPDRPGEFYKRRVDMTTCKDFAPDDFMGAIKYIGLI